METKQSGTDGTQQTSRTSGGWLFPAFLTLLLLVLLGITRWAPDQAPTQKAGLATDWKSAPAAGETVGLTIDYGNGASKEFTALPWRAEMTVADLLAVAREYRPGIEFSQIGEGERGFLSSIDGLANEGAGGRNWIYRVDGQHGHVSFCLEKLKLDMQVLWIFTDELYNAETVEMQDSSGNP